MGHGAALIVVVLGIALVASSGCEGDPPQGPQNASFELDGDHSFEGAYLWPRTDHIGGGITVPTHINPGTGFMPTEGQYYLYAVSNGGVDYAGVYQDDVDLSASTELVFDYEAMGMIPTGSISDGAATFEVLFTASGTQTLYTRTFTPGDPSDQVLGAVATIGSQPKAGRLTFQVRLTNPMDAGIINSPSLALGLDNIRVR